LTLLTFFCKRIGHRGGANEILVHSIGILSSEHGQKTATIEAPCSPDKSGQGMRSL
jgi:hypothetical protein